MGLGTWSTPVYAAAATYRKSTGASDFEYSDSGHTVTHPALSPSRQSMGAKGARESHDSPGHPSSLAIMVMLDVTGSMSHVPRHMQKRLPELFDLLLSKGEVADPQILFGAIGDATVDNAPLQVGQFESDNRADGDIRNLVLEGGGGGGNHESYELALYFAARKTQTDCVEKRNKSGFLFLIGDECAYPAVKKDEVERLMGDLIEDDIPLQTILDEAIEKYNVFYILPSGTAHAEGVETLRFWRALLGQNVIQLEDLDRVCEVIATAVGQGEE